MHSGLLPSDSYLVLPDTAKPLASRVKVEGEKPHPPGGIYYVDVVVRKASLLEELAAVARPDGADLVPEEALVPPGSNFGERRQQNLRQMDRSQEVAAAVALRELGYDVNADPEGALVVGVASDAPAAGKLEPTDVIVAVDGKPVHTPDDLRRLIATHEPGETVKLRVRRGGDDAGGRGRHDREPDGEGAADRRDPGRAVRRHQAAGRRRDRPRPASAAPRPGSPSRSTSSRSCAATSTAGSRWRRRARSSSTAASLPIGGVKQKVIGAKRAGRGRLPRRRLGRTRRRHGGMQGILRDHPCGEFSTGVAGIGNA